MMIDIGIKYLHEKAQKPFKKHSDDVGYDLFATNVEKRTIELPNTTTEDHLVFGTGISLEIPEDYYIKVVPRSSITKTNLMMHNSVGIIDPSYRGELKILCVVTDLSKTQATFDHFRNLLDEGPIRLCQLVVHKRYDINFREKELSKTERGQGGFGSTGMSV